MRVKVGDIIGFRKWEDDKGKVGLIDIHYLILKTRNRFRYIALFLGDGHITELDKSYVDKYAVKVV